MEVIEKITSFFALRFKNMGVFMKIMHFFQIITVCFAIFHEKSGIIAT
jgi:hypothetical protein